jgi:metal-sulfur cluster biosynthetic enzyme
VRQRGLRIDGIHEVEIELVWEPPWSVHHMSPEGKAMFGVKDAGYG